MINVLKIKLIRFWKLITDLVRFIFFCKNPAKINSNKHYWNCVMYNIKYAIPILLTKTKLIKLTDKQFVKHYSLFNDKTKLSKIHIYDPDQDQCQHQIKFNFIHYVLKYKIIIPLLLVIEYLVEDYLVDDIPNLPHNRALKIVWDQMIIAEKQWTFGFIRTYFNLNDKKQQTNEFYEQLYQSSKVENGIGTIKFIRRLIFTIALYDTSYRELVVMIAHSITKGMVGHYGGNVGDNHVQHLVYMENNPYDVQYYYLHREIENNIIKRKMVRLNV